MGHFRLQVDPAAVESAGRRLGEVGARLDGCAPVLDGVRASLDGAWEGEAAAVAERELSHLAAHVRRSVPHFVEAAAALTALARSYRDAEEVAIPSLNQRWDEAHARCAQAVATAQARRIAAASALLLSPAAGPTDPRRRIDAAAADAVADANAALRATLRQLVREYDDLVDSLRRQTRRAGEALRSAVLAGVPGVTVAAHTGLDGPGWVGALFPGPDLVAAFAGTLPLGTLDRRAARLAEDDVAGLQALLDEARRSGLPPAEYSGLLQDYWVARALRDAGIDPAAWNPSEGAEANRETILAVYAYYGRLYLDHPELQWAGMANLVGPSFAAGFFDIAEWRRLATAIADLPPHLRAALPRDAAKLGELTAEELRFYETALLEMQKNIFVDQGSMHAAYVHGGLAALEEMHAAGLIDRRTAEAWRKIETGRLTGDARLLREGNKQLLRREQFEIIGHDYDRMRNHSPTGGAVTWAITLLGTPSIPGARGYAEVFPKVVEIETLGPHSIGTPRSINGWRIPGVSVDNPLQVSVEIETPFPDGNISDRHQRWALIEKDTLLRYLELVEGDPERLRRLIESPLADRIEEQRLHNPIDEIVDRLADWEVDVDQ